MSLEILPLSYHQDCAEAWFSQLEHLPWAMLLSSATADHADARYDILTADPLITLTTRGESTEIAQDGNLSHSSEDPMTLIEQALAQLPVVETQAFPFCGGAVGLWGYDLARRFEKLPNIAQQDLSTPDMAVGIYDWALIADHQQQRLSLVCLSDAQRRLAWLTQQHPEQTDDFQLLSAWQSNLSEQQYRAQFTRIQEYIQAGDCYQVNLAQRFTARYQGSEWQAYQRLSQQNRAPFSAFIRLPASAILSLSPERFLKVSEQQIETKPIKGTLPRKSLPAEDQQQKHRLANSVKDRAENLMIVDLLRNDIGRIAEPGSVAVPQLFAIESFPAVHHLVSTVTGHLPSATPVSHLLRACFPGGSITGAPKIRAMEIIDELEPHRRNAWCGSIGYLSRCGRMDTSITIRTLIAEQHYLYCTAGGGIVADSDCQAEYEETFHKVSRILPLLAPEE